MYNLSLSLEDYRYSFLKNYKNILLNWHRSVNLISFLTIQDIWGRHFLDSLQLLDYIPYSIKSIIDLGAGAGFPGLALSIATGIKTSLVESNYKKCIFLQEIIVHTSANCIVYNCRIKDYYEDKSVLVICRALSSLSIIINYTFNIAQHNGVILLLKGKNIVHETKEAAKLWKFNYAIFRSKISQDGIIIKIWNIHSINLLQK